MNEYFKWIAVIILAVSRKIIGGKMGQLISSADSSKKTLQVQGISYIQESVAYKSFITIILSTGTNEVLQYFILGVPFLMNMYLCYQVISLNAQITKEVDQEEQLRLRINKVLMKLIVNELTEFLVPVIFVITFALAFYGPNATFIGNVQNNYWQYQKVQDLSSHVTGILTMTAFDGLSAVISMSLLWIVCKIDCVLFFKKHITELTPF